MYAITSSGFRAIASADDVQQGEAAVDQLPASLLVTIKANELRAQRTTLLRACDWTQCEDAPLTATGKANWAAYRQALRNVPEQAGFPDAINWPVSPP